jgi:hypothetical protein
VQSDGSAAICTSPGEGTYFELVRVPESKTVENGMHLGRSVSSLDDLDTEV